MSFLPIIFSIIAFGSKLNLTFDLINVYFQAGLYIKPTEPDLLSGPTRDPVSSGKCFQITLETYRRSDPFRSALLKWTLTVNTRLAYKMTKDRMRK